MMTHRTNSHAEAAHRRLQSVLQMNHPSIWTFNHSLCQVQKKRDILYEQMVAGHTPTAKQRKYRDSDRRILTLMGEFHTRPMSEYLRKVGHNFEMHDWLAYVLYL